MRRAVVGRRAVRSECGGGLAWTDFVGVAGVLVGGGGGGKVLGATIPGSRRRSS